MEAPDRDRSEDRKSLPLRGPRGAPKPEGQKEYVVVALPPRVVRFTVMTPVSVP